MTTRAPRPPQAVCESLIADQGFECPECMGPLSFEELRHYEVDHTVPKALGGTDEITNLRVLHAACHRKNKTPQDIKAISKADRQAKAHAAHTEALRKNTRRPSKRKRQLRKWKEEQRLNLLAPRQE